MRVNIRYPYYHHTNEPLDRLPLHRASHDHGALGIENPSIGRAGYSFPVPQGYAAATAAEFSAMATGSSKYAVEEALQSAERGTSQYGFQSEMICLYRIDEAASGEFTRFIIFEQSAKNTPPF